MTLDASKMPARRLKTLRVRCQRLGNASTQARNDLARAEYRASSPRRQRLMSEYVARMMASFAKSNPTSTEEDLARYFAVFTTDPELWCWVLGSPHIGTTPREKVGTA